MDSARPFQLSADEPLVERRLIDRAQALKVNAVLLKGKVLSEDIQKALEEAVGRRAGAVAPRRTDGGRVGVRGSDPVGRSVVIIDGIDGLPVE